MFTRKAVIDFGIAVKTADALGQVQADDGFVYYVKDDARGRLIRASEWLGTQVAEICGIAAPTPAIIDARRIFPTRLHQRPSPARS